MKPGPYGAGLFCCYSTIKSMLVFDCAEYQLFRFCQIGKLIEL